MFENLLLSGTWLQLLKVHSLYSQQLSSHNPFRYWTATRTTRWKDNVSPVLLRKLPIETQHYIHWPQHIHCIVLCAKRCVFSTRLKIHVKKEFNEFVSWPVGGAYFHSFVTARWQFWFSKNQAKRCLFTWKVKNVEHPRKNH